MATPKKLLSLLFVVLVVFVGLIAFILIYKENKNLQQQAQQAQQVREPIPATPGAPQGIPQPTFPPLPPEVAPVYSYAGRVLDVNSDRKVIALETARGIKEVTYTVTTKMVLRKQPTADEQQRLTPAQLQKISTEEAPFTGTVAKNDAIIAEASEDLRGKDAFTAVKIIILR